MLERHPRVLVAHRRAPVQRMLRTNLEADGLAVATASTPGACLASLRTGHLDAVVLDADLIRADSTDSAALFRFLVKAGTPTLLVSWDPGDRLLARSLRDAPFISRPDNIDQITASVQHLIGATARA